MPGRDYSVEARVEAGRAIDRLGVAAIQAGFPVVGEEHAEAVRRLAPVTDADVTALARARPGDVDAAVDAGADVVSLFATTSDVMLEHVFGTDREAVFGMLEESVERAEDAGVPVRIGLMDGFRTDAEHVVEAAERFSGYTLGLADTIENALQPLSGVVVGRGVGHLGEGRRGTRRVDGFVGVRLSFSHLHTYELREYYC